MKIIKGLAALFTAAMLATPAVADDYPERPVEFIVPWSPGGGSDTLMRLVSANIEPHLGVELPIINMPGVGGTVGLREASRRNADGYTISQVHEGLLMATLTGLTELTWEDFEPIALMTASPQFLITKPTEDYSNFDEFVAYAKASPNELTMGVTLGGLPHLFAAMIEQAYDLKFKYVGYEGTGERVRAVVGGNLDLIIGDVASSLEFAKNGDLDFLVAGSAERHPALPEIPTFREKGEDILLTVTRGIVMPKGTPEEVRNVMEAALQKLSQDETYIEQTNNAGSQVTFMGQEEYRAYLAKLDATVKSLASVVVQ